MYKRDRLWMFSSAVMAASAWGVYLESAKAGVALYFTFLLLIWATESITKAIRSG